jgi:hypothetical protein
LTEEVVNYLQSHQSNAYDRVALEIFARNLYENGYRDRAASVFFFLLSTEHDRTQQAQFLRRCVACWQDDNNNNGIGLLEYSRDSSSEIGAQQISDTHVFEKLIRLLDRRLPVPWLIDVATEAGLGDDFVAKLCEYVLFTPPLGSSSRARWAGAPKDSQCGDVSPPPMPWEAEKELLIKYTYVLTSSLKKTQSLMLERIEQLEFDASDAMGEGVSNSLDAAVKDDRWAMLSDIMRHPFVIAPWAAIAVLGDARHPVVRALLVLPLAVLLPSCGESYKRLGRRKGKQSSSLGKI